MASEETADKIIRRLGLSPHPEGGYYAETFRSTERVTLPDGRIRAAGTAIYFLLPEGSFSALHRVAADEAWHHYGGLPLELVTIAPDGELSRTRLGRDLASGERPQHVVPAGHWQGARPMVPMSSTGNVGVFGNGEAGSPMGDGYTLVGCTVSPGFDFEDFDMPGREELTDLFPGHRDCILEFTYP